MGVLSVLLFGKNPKQKADVSALVKNGALVIDARTQGEFDSGHLQDAVNIPHNNIDRQIGQYAKTKEQPIVVYCHSGARSAHACKVLTRMGYSQVSNGGSLRHMRKALEK